MNKSVFLIAALIFLSGCSTDKNDSGGKKGKNKSSVQDDSLTSFRSYGIDTVNPVKLSLPSDLKEVSGVTYTSDGRIFVHQDESSMIYEVDSTGAIGKRFAVGKPALRGDFEDIETVGNDFYLVSSNGDIYEFRETENGEYAEYNKYETPLKSSHDVEGLCYDPVTNSLLLACKGYHTNLEFDKRNIYSFSLATKTLNEDPRFIIDLNEAGKEFNPSGITRNPLTGTYYIISSTGKSIIELSPDGKYLGSRKLPGKLHEQPEGIAFAPDNSLTISNEGSGGKGYLVNYKYLGK